MYRFEFAMLYNLHQR